MNTLPGSPIIQVRNIKRSFRSPKKEEGMKGHLNLLFRPQYSHHEALKGVSFEIESGAFVGLIGANGAGKTTLLKILSGLIPPSEGETRVLGFDPFKRAIEFRQRISLVMGQKAQLWWDLPAVDAFDLLRAIYEIPMPIYKERVNTLAELLDVTKHMRTQIRRLSLGERMKMELIGALIHWPSVIFLDEPTIGLDVLAAHKLREFLREFNHREKATIILTSHNMEDIERLCTRVMILRNGEMIFDGKPGLLTHEGEVRLRVRLKEAPSIAELASVTAVPAESIEVKVPAPDTSDEDEKAAESAPTYFNIRKELSVQVLQKLMGRYQVIDMGIEELSLETVIHRLYEEKV